MEDIINFRKGTDNKWRIRFDHPDGTCTQGELALSYEDIIAGFDWNAIPPPIARETREFKSEPEVFMIPDPIIEVPIIPNISVVIETAPFAEPMDFFSRCRKSGLIKD